MGKKAEQNRLVHKGDGVAVEQTSIYDDSLLPSAEELAKLQSIDPTCIDWVKKRTEIEQDARIKFNMDKMDLMRKEVNHIFAQNILLIAVTSLIIIFIIGCAAYFVYKGLNVEGTIFGGLSMILAVSVFVRWHPKGNDKER